MKEDQSQCIRDIRRVREEKKISLRVMASRCGISAMYLSEIERGMKIPSIGVIQRMLENYEVGTTEYSETVMERFPQDRDILLDIKKRLRLSDTKFLSLLFCWDEFRRTTRALSYGRLE